MMDRTRVKICGLRCERDVEAAIIAGADAVGFVFVKDSPRWITPDEAADLVCMLPPLMMPFGVFANTPISDVAAMSTDACIEVVQLHGRETEHDIEELQTEFAVARGVHFGTEQYHHWKSSRLIDLLLIDGSAGGGGMTFAWRSLTQDKPEICAPFLIAGGLTPQNVGKAIRAAKPFGVDVSSGVEQEPGRKDPELIRAFCRAVREADFRQYERVEDEDE